MNTDEILEKLARPGIYVCVWPGSVAFVETDADGVQHQLKPETFERDGVLRRDRWNSGVGSSIHGPFHRARAVEPPSKEWCMAAANAERDCVGDPTLGAGLHLAAPQEGRNHGLDTDEHVRFYEHDFYPLSNFSAFNLRWQGLTFPTSEHAYHCQKFRCNERRFQIASAPSAHEAFKLAERHKGERRKDWDDVKVGIMREILLAKVVQHEYVRRKLLATGDRTLIEDSWRDDFWGWGPNRDGQNMLGKLWMEIRAEIRTQDGERGHG